MQFSNISHIELAKIFVYSKQEKIEKLLGVKSLDAYTATRILYRFIKNRGASLLDTYENKYSLLFDDVFFYMVINELKNAQSNGVRLENITRFRNPHIAYIS